MNRMSIPLLPIIAQSATYQSKSVTGKMRYHYPRKNQESAVIGCQVQIEFPLRCLPTNELITGGALPGRRAEQQTCDGRAGIIAYQIAQILSDNATQAQIVMRHQMSKKECILIRTRFDRSYLKGLKIFQGTTNRCSIRQRQIFNAGEGPFYATIVDANSRKGEQATVLKFEKKAPGGKGLENSGRGFPVPIGTEFFCDTVQAPPGMSFYQVANPDQIGFLNGSALTAKELGHARTKNHIATLVQKNPGFFCYADLNSYDTSDNGAGCREDLQGHFTECEAPYPEDRARERGRLG